MTDKKSYFSIFNPFHIFDTQTIVLSDNYNMCFSPVLQSGYLVGSNYPSTNIQPPETADGTSIYSYQANIVTGEFIVKFGVTGNTHLFTDATETNPINLIIYEQGSELVELMWDETLLYYSGVDLDSALALSEELGNDLCFSSIVIPKNIIHYTFEEISTGA